MFIFLFKNLAFKNPPLMNFNNRTDSNRHEKNRKIVSEQEFGEILSAVVKIQMHPDYNPFTFEADLAVVELAQTIDFDQYKQPIALG